jgi:hypothetical protein
MNLQTIISQAAEARALGFTRFSTGEPCNRGHLSERSTSNGCCVACKAFIRKRIRARRAAVLAVLQGEHGQPWG